MDFLKQIAAVAKQHFEKILLTLALLGLAAAVWILYQASLEEQRKLGEMIVGVTGRKVQGVTPIPLGEFEKALQSAKSPKPLELTPPHNLVNPVRWQRKADGTLLPIRTGEEIGIGQLVVTNMTPLYYRITLTKVFSPGSYSFLIVNEAATNRFQFQVVKTANMTDNRKNDIFVLLESKGAPENPELTLELVGTQQRVTLTKDQPYQRVEGYTADLKYNVDNQVFKARRVGNVIRFGGEDYLIVAINEGEVVLSALLNNKKHSIKYNPAGR